MEKYPFLRFAASVLRVVGWILLVGGIIGSIVLGMMMGTLVDGGIGVGVLVVVGGIIGSFLSWLFLLISREIIYLLVHVEENTRITAENTGITTESITKESR